MLSDVAVTLELVGALLGFVGSAGAGAQPKRAAHNRMQVKSKIPFFIFSPLPVGIPVRLIAVIQ